MPVSAEPGLVKRYSTPASFRVWISSMPPVPVMVLRMGSLALGAFTPILPADALYQAAAWRASRWSVALALVARAEHGGHALDGGGLAEHGAEQALARGSWKISDDHVSAA